MRILITEEALQADRGHWPSYVGDLASAFRDAGDVVDVLTHREASGAVVDRVGGSPWYSRNCWVEPRSQGKIGGLRHNWHFGRETAAWLETEPLYDWVLALTMRLQHLLAFAVLARRTSLAPTSRYLLLFVQGFGQFKAPGVATDFPNNLSNRLARLAFAWVAPAVRAGKVVLAAETKGMQEELERFTGLPVSLFPHPVAHPPDAPTSAFRPPASGLITITCPGFARHEKGSDLLQEAIIRILDTPAWAHLRFVLQWPEPFEMPDGSALGPDAGLADDLRVEWINHALDPEGYAALLDRTDFAILPYRSESYHNRLSRVAIEAAGKGIPLIYTAHTWTEEVAEMAGGGVRIEEETAESVVVAILNAIERRATLAATAKANAPAIREFHSATTFRGLLLGHE